jgi:hypothetical protein
LNRSGRPARVMPAGVPPSPSLFKRPKAAQWGGAAAVVGGAPCASLLRRRPPDSCAAALLAVGRWRQEFRSEFRHQPQQADASQMHSAPARPPGPLSHIHVHRSVLHSQQCGAVLLLIDPRRCMGGQRIPCCRTAAEFYGRPRASIRRMSLSLWAGSLCSQASVNPCNNGKRSDVCDSNCRRRGSSSNSNGIFATPTRCRWA